VKAGIVSEVASTDGVSWCAISSNDGFIQEVAGAPAIYLEGIASLTPTILETSKSLLSNIKLGEPNSVTLNGSDGCILVTTINDSFSLICKTQSGANLGLVRRNVANACTNLIPLFK
jgi:predicted regulator of Ras-like GTPase activity (Roadblock/LC7/MglB family)